MNYEEKYNNVVNALQSLIDNGKKQGHIIIRIADIENAIPELAESEDEKTRKEFCKDIWTFIPNEKAHKYIAWLDKQGGQRKISHEEICKSYGISEIGEFSDGFHTFNGLYHQRMILFAVLVKTYKDKAWKSWKHEDGLDCFGGGWFIVGIDTPAGTYTYHYKAKDWSRFDCQSLEKAKHWDGHDETDVERLFTLIQPLEGKTAFDAIKEKKVDNANKVEPKFEIGYWICNGGGNPCKVDDIFGNYYELCSIGGYKYNKLISDVDANYHRWTIEDAKDGDVLCYKDEISLFEHDIKNCTEKGTTFGGFVYHCCYDGKRFMIDSLYSLTEQDKIDIHPATKEQRELLFKKMNDAWYEWDDENKILISM